MVFKKTSNLLISQQKVQVIAEQKGDNDSAFEIQVEPIMLKIADQPVLTGIISFGLA